LFQFLQPIWFSALAGIAVPVIIHLWNQRPGKTLKVGSVSLVAESLQRYQNRLQLSEILLLILRCLLIVFIVLALAGPEWRSATGKNAKGWVLTNRPGLSTTYQHFRPIMDSLLLAGFEFHFFEEGFKKEKLEHALADSGNSRAGSSYRTLVAALDRQTDTALPVYIFTDHYLHNFNGDRTAVGLNLHWYMYNPDSAVVLTAGDTAALHITIFTGHYTSDAHYLLAALEAIRQFTKKNIGIQLVTGFQDIPAQQDWLFCLEETIPAYKFDAKNVLFYAGGNAQHIASVILPAGEALFTPVDVNNLVIEKDSAEQLYDVRWQDGFGHPVLTVQQQAGQTRYKLYTHINPAWTELPWSDNFPSVLYGLLYPDQATKSFRDRENKTMIDPVQAMPLMRSSKEDNTKPGSYTVTALAGVCWLVVFVLFFAERSLSFYYAKTKANG
jgi:hypothetical protein